MPIDEMAVVLQTGGRRPLGPAHTVDRSPFGAKRRQYVAPGRDESFLFGTFAKRKLAGMDANTAGQRSIAGVTDHPDTGSSRVANPRCGPRVANGESVEERRQGS